VIYFVRNRFVGVPYDWLRVIVGKPRVSEFYGYHTNAGKF